MPTEDKEHNDQIKIGKDEFVVVCPYCGSEKTSPVDPKKMLDDKAMYACRVCNQLFERERNNSK